MDYYAVTKFEVIASEQINWQKIPSCCERSGPLAFLVTLPVHLRCNLRPDNRVFDNKYWNFKIVFKYSISLDPFLQNIHVGTHKIANIAMAVTRIGTSIDSGDINLNSYKMKFEIKLIIILSIHHKIAVV